MARYSRMQTLTLIKQIGLLPLFYHPDSDTAKKIASACLAGGARVIEFTNRGDRAIEPFTELVKHRDTDSPDLVLGVGSVLDAPTAAAYIAAGADFIVAPIFCPETARLCNARKIPYLPGCGSLNEIHTAHQAGVEICKLFPANTVGGPAFVKAARAPMPFTDILPTGGVSPDPENLREWFTAGAAAVGMGSKLVSKQLIAAGDYASLTDTVRKTLETINTIRIELKE
ncbi:Putative KHG/KDPG aldolase [Anaerohalosphaera lusitana]|uniref:Putative KHG/KDPG aldolase n=1 Tax=Anaerohalosphaera lusitana TaxID=1936003 RepID=A0A1U9NPY1_9BACT|nr:bifunctional 4-hydroxy-2-oxoglutarate aldolase/2-dehydro-3-deoxy-phosphogluconate aldolase [Anaerohalosphaera lusitana]AQT69992.1 Putative KHG/KDPG aldolase [Anaerohalosphaera lusitana]